MIPLPTPHARPIVFKQEIHDKHITCCNTEGTRSVHLKPFKFTHRIKWTVGVATVTEGMVKVPGPVIMPVGWKERDLAVECSNKQFLEQKTARKV